MTRPVLIEQKLSLGQDAYGRAVTATRRKAYDGKTVWDIVSQPLSQRDEGERMRGLCDDNLRALAQALEVVRS